MKHQINIPLIGGNALVRPSYLVIHAMAEYIRITEEGSKWFRDKKKANIPPRDYHAAEWLKLRRLSAHKLFAPNGVVISCRNLNMQAWHAAEFNPKAVGFEYLVEGAWDYFSFLTKIKEEWVTPAQYKSGLIECRKVLHPHMAPVRHSDIAPDRKYDPGDGFPWKEFLTDLNLV
ncbi:hypothetical protein LCGC14_0501050 [marine sediment metagenome]|uniref:N-acetylmuramoyl-L-alanine amidase n=1 Tax=marine sediment metagenome TaxID=412755 RepID=A0A0F9S3V2_9ZZZZ|nr:hypothetical protein [Pricia sp.]